MKKPMHFPCDGVYHRMGIYWKKAPILCIKYENKFSTLSPLDELCCLFPCYRKLLRKPIHFPCDKVYHWMGIFCCIFSYNGKLMGKFMCFPYDEVYHRMGISWEKSTHTMGKVRVPISQVFPMQWVLLHFPVQ